jgi:hypothetical protein
MHTSNNMQMNAHITTLASVAAELACKDVVLFYECTHYPVQ